MHQFAEKDKFLTSKRSTHKTANDQFSKESSDQDNTFDGSNDICGDKNIFNIINVYEM